MNKIIHKNFNKYRPTWIIESLSDKDNKNFAHRFNTSLLFSLIALFLDLLFWFGTKYISYSETR